MPVTLTFVHPTLEVSVQSAVAAVSCVQMVVSARTDMRPMNRGLHDDVNAVDLATIAVGKQLADAAQAGESLDFALTKALQDVVAGADVLSIVAEFYRNFADLATAVDVPQVTTGKPLFDAAAGSDAATITAGKALADTATSSEAQRFVVGKGLADIAASVDAAAIATTKATSDAAKATDAGMVRMTDYADITYFESDFVGTSQPF